MAGLRVIRARDLVRVPWKDGGGTTAEVAASPPGAGFADFAWRISIADVGMDGPFSRFPGIDRTLVLGQGRDMTLTVAGVPHHLAEPGDSLAFAGEAATAARLGGGPIRDLNVMTQRGLATHRVERMPAGLDPDADVTALVALAEGVAVTADGCGFTLAGLDVLLVEGRGAVLAAEGDAVLVSLHVERGRSP